MEFRLIYRGSLKGSNDKEHKHDLRRKFHPQLKKLWGQTPLKEFLLLKGGPDIDFKRIQQSFHIGHGFDFGQEVGNCFYVPLVRSELHLVAQLRIVLLRPEPPGEIITQGGDIDNRLKTLFDALRKPVEAKEVPSRWCPEQTENPMYCLLQNDSLITTVKVTTDRLLEPAPSSEVVLLIHVRVRGTRTTSQNLSLIG